MTAEYQDTPVSQLIINQLTKAEYDSIQNPSDTELYLVTDEGDTPSSIDIDDKTITLNSSDEIQTVAVLNDNDKTNGIKTWTGTRAQYDAIVSKDANTLYNITDDTDVTLSLLELLYPVGSIYIGTMANCPLATLGVGTWQLKGTGIVKAGDIPCKGNGYSVGLTNGTQTMGLSYSGNTSYGLWGAINSYGSTIGSTPSGDPSTSKTVGITTDPTKSGIVGDTSSLELSCNIWERIS